MPQVEAVVECPVYDSFRVQQVAGLFDVQLPETSRESFPVEVPALDDSWTIGAIVGPSGSGKSTVARHVYSDDVYSEFAWPDDKAVVDCFGELPIKRITHMLTAVGFSSPPSWIKPYAVLSGGEKFRCDLARALLLGAGGEPPETPPDDAQSSAGAPLVVFDEFTSVVDRTVARIGSAAVAKAIRSGRVARRFVAVTCHYDILEWLEPDWTLDMARMRLERRRLRRPRIELRLFRCRGRAWQLFKRHHYLSAALNPAAHCYVAMYDGAPVAFCAVLSLMGRKGRRRISRIVVLPDYQGVGIGARVLDAVAELYRRRGERMNIVTSHPSMIAGLVRSPRWRLVACKPTGYTRDRLTPANYRRSCSLGRSVVSFEYVGGAVEA
ncbi:MAG: GNAT family N-acetyltransferase [Pirellulaceae bacterium]